MTEKDPLQSIVQTVKDITEGKWNKDIDVNTSGMIGELAHYINKTLKNLRFLDKSLGANVEETPRALSEVQAVIKHTEQATIKVLDNAEVVLNAVGELNETIEQSRSADAVSLSKQLDAMAASTQKLESAAYDIINTMEFQDVTQQRIMSIMGCLENIEKSLIDLLIIFKIKEQQANREESLEILKHLHSGSLNQGNKQDLVDQLLAEFGI